MIQCSLAQMLKKRYEALRCIPFSEHVINMRCKTTPPSQCRAGEWGSRLLYSMVSYVAIVTAICEKSGKLV